MQPLQVGGSALGGRRDERDKAAGWSLRLTQLMDQAAWSAS